MRGPASRMIGHLVFGEVENAVEASSVLCLPMGSIEQHGPHLPLNTDCVIAEALTRRIVARWGDEHDLWQLPVVPVGLSREHAWAPGTLSLTVSGMTAYLRDLGCEIVRALPARNLLIVNGHGGNRGILEALTREMCDFGLNIATLHLGAMMSPDTAADVPEIHAGKDETSVMLVLAPELVRREATGRVEAGARRRSRRKRSCSILPRAIPGAATIRAYPRRASWAMRAEHPPRTAKLIIARVVEGAGAVIRRLKDNAATKRRG